MDDATLRAALDPAPEPLAVLDESGTFRYANAAYTDRFGFGSDDLVASDCLGYVHGDDADALRECLRRVADGAERSATAEFRHRTADGSWTWIDGRLWSPPDPAVDGLLLSARSVDDRRRAERRLEELQRTLDQITSNTDDVLWMFDADWEELLFVNDAYERLWGMSIEDLEDDARTFLEGIHPEDRDRVREAMATLSAGDPVEVEYRVNSEVDYNRWVWVRGQPVTEDGEVVRVVGFVRDVTDRRRRERQLKVIDHLLRHNLRNDMNVILGNAGLCVDHEDPDVVERMERIRETGRSLLETAEKEREIVDIIAGNPDGTTVDLAAVLREELAGVREDFPESTVEVDAPVSAEVVAIPHVHLAVRELLENAIEHATTDPAVSVRLRETEDGVELLVADNAPAIPAHEVGPLFGDEAPSDLYHGTGLGLWLVYWIVDLSDGTLEFETDGEDGNVVTVRFSRPAA